MTDQKIVWQAGEVKSPNLDQAVRVIVAKDVPYVASANRLQNLNIYIHYTHQNSELIGQPVTSLPISASGTTPPKWLVHVHGGAWRDPQLLSWSIEPTVAHAFVSEDTAHPITAVVSLDYTLSPFPTHPTLPYDPVKDNHSDPGRDAVHPMHIHDVLRGLAFVRSLGLTDDSYILSGHSAGACLTFQSVLFSPRHWGFDDVADPPRPAALLGMNGLYDLPNLVYGLGATHANLSDVYADLIGIAFGSDESTWPAASPGRVDPKELSDRVQDGKAPQIIVLDQSTEDQLVPVNQTESLEALLKQIKGLEVVRGSRCTGEHAAPWKEGYMIWDNVSDILKIISGKLS